MGAQVRGKTQADVPGVAALAERFWGSDLVVNSAGRYVVSALDGLVAAIAGDVVGLVAFAIEDGACHIVALATTRPNRGIGSALLAAAENAAGRLGCPRVWLITTNDNLDALRFYQRRGYRLAALHAGAVAAARAIKPSIPAIGIDGIPLRDELVLEKHP
ncbi:MAG: GNAT family N-acetyltransferase [Alphaproteobacteria bacterium]